MNRLRLAQLWVAGTAFLCLAACADRVTSASSEAYEQGVVHVQQVVFGENGYTTTAVEQLVTKVHRPGRPRAIMPIGDAIVRESARYTPYASSNPRIAASVDGGASARRGHMRFLARAVQNGKAVDLYSVDQRPGRSFHDPSVFLLAVDGRPVRVIEPEYEKGAGRPRMRGVSITDTDDRGRPRRAIRITFTGFTLACSAATREPSRVVAWAVRLGAAFLPTALWAAEGDGVDICINTSLQGLLQELGWEVVGGALSGLGDMVDMVSLFGTLAQLDCLLAIWTLPMVSPVIVTCPPCYYTTKWWEEWDEWQQMYVTKYETKEVCNDHSGCTSNLP